MAVNLIVRATPSEVSLATLIRYDRLPASQVWTVLSAVHRRLARACSGLLPPPW